MIETILLKTLTDIFTLSEVTGVPPLGGNQKFCFFFWRPPPLSISLIQSMQWTMTSSVTHFFPGRLAARIYFSEDIAIQIVLGPAISTTNTSFYVFVCEHLKNYSAKRSQPTQCVTEVSFFFFSVVPISFVIFNHIFSFICRLIYYTTITTPQINLHTPQIVRL